MHGLITFLISKSRIANELRKRLVFKIIPMANPDGVIIGNTRTTLIGKDMNRQFPSSGLGSSNDKEPLAEESKLNPIPFAIREMLQQTLKTAEQGIHSFWDIHQHSMRKSIFIYGPYFPLHSDKYLQIRLIPKLLSERSEMFRFYSCRFRKQDKSSNYKESCARMAIGRQFSIANCFTLECSSFGYISKKEQRTLQFKEADLIEFGKSLAESILEYQLVMERDAKVRKQILDRIKVRKTKLDQIRQQSPPPLIKHSLNVKRSQT